MTNTWSLVSHILTIRHIPTATLFTLKDNEEGGMEGGEDEEEDDFQTDEEEEMEMETDTQPQQKRKKVRGLFLHKLFFIIS